MRKTDEQIKQKRRERFEYHAVRAAKHLGLADVEKYIDLPTHIKIVLEAMPYGRVVAPLIQKEYSEGWSLGKLANKYGLCRTSIANYRDEALSTCLESVQY